MIAAVGLSAAAAVLRYRLYDIDRLISRTLSWVAVTALLGLGYVALVLAGQAVFSSFAGGSNLAIAVSTLVVAALFLPLRSRVQRLVDRRFYRRRYDAEQTLEAFGARLREQVELDSVTADLRPRRRRDDAAGAPLDLDERGAAVSRGRAARIALADRRRERRARRSWAAVVALVGGAEQHGRLFFVLITALIVAASVVGGLVATRQPANPIGWILCGFGAFMGFAALAAGYAQAAPDDAAHGLGQAATWFANWSFAALTALAVLRPAALPRRPAAVAALALRRSGAAASRRRCSRSARRSIPAR